MYLFSIYKAKSSENAFKLVMSKILFSTEVTLLNAKSLDQPNLKAFAQDQFKVTKQQFLSLMWYKTLWEKEKMLVTSILSFSVFPKGFFCRVIVARHEWQHNIFIGLWKVSMEAAILFAGFMPCSS